MVLHLDCFGNRVLFATNRYLDSSVGQRNRTLDSVAASDEVFCRLICSTNFFAISADANASNLVVAVLICKNERALLDALLNTSVERLQLTERLMDGHLFSSH